MFIKLANVESIQNFTLLNQQYEVHDMHTEVLRESVDRWSSVHRFDFDMNVGWVELCDYGVTSGSNPHNDLIVYNNPNSSPHLHIHPLVIGTDEDDEEWPNNDDGFNH